MIWSTYGLSKDAAIQGELPAYHLYPYAFSLLDFDTGLVPRLWTAYADTDRHVELLRLLGYDTLYGDTLAYGSPFPFQKIAMRLGIDEITVTALTSANQKDFFVTGENFTESSHVFVNGHRVKTNFISENSLYIEGEKLEIGDEITVVQISTDLRRLSESNPFVVTTINCGLWMTFCGALPHTPQAFEKA